MITTDEMESLFNRAAPQLFQRDVLQLLVKCYPEAESARNTYGLRKPIADWHQPFIRRAIIESQLIELAGRYPQLEPEIRYTKNRTMPYVAIRAGQFIITESKVDEPIRLPRDADFRTENSLVNYSLFAQFDDSPPDSPIYVILAHVPHFDEPRPVSVRWLFPFGDYSGVWHNIDLLERFGGIDGLPGYGPSSPPVVGPTPQLRKPADDKGKAQS